MSPAKATASRLDLSIFRSIAGLFFLIPGIFKVFMPADFQGFLQYFPEIFGPYLMILFYLVIVVEILGGLALIAGWNTRLFGLPLAFVIVAALMTVVINDNDSVLQYMSGLFHVMAFFFYAAFYFFGAAKKDNKKDKDMLDKFLPRDEKTGLVFIRVGIATLFIGISFGILFAPDLFSKADTLLTGSIGLGGIAAGVIFFLLTAAVGKWALIGYQMKATSIVGLILVLFSLIFLALPDMQTSQIGLINLLFHILLAGALIDTYRNSDMLQPKK